MERVHGLGALPSGDGRSVVTVGFFDGVHLGHRAVLERTVERARERQVPAVAVTFDRHPREILTPGSEPRLLTTVDRKATLIQETGIDTLVVLAFTLDLSQWPAERFITDVLQDRLRAEHCVMGANFTFGHKAAGNVDRLIEVGPSHGFTAERVELVDLDGRRVSSSSIREALSAGDLDWPEKALGRRFVLDGTVVRVRAGPRPRVPHGEPADLARLLLPGRGIYAGRAGSTARPRRRHQRRHQPHVRHRALHVESYLLDFEGDLIDRPMAVEFWSYLRDEAASTPPRPSSRP
jgi:riboflavin kinase/FMN adenylyltransferase